MATEVTGAAGPTSRRCPCTDVAQLFVYLRGLRRPFSRVWRVGRTGVGGTVPRVVADLAAQRCIVAGMASPGKLAEQCRGVIPGRVV
jgi:hypothetical protein